MSNAEAAGLEAAAPLAVAPGERAEAGHPAR